jgi:hypothetical protein
MFALRISRKRWVELGGIFVAASVAVTAIVLYSACVTNPNTDGSKVPKIGSDASIPECGPLCDRLAALCGYAPVDCVDLCKDFGPEQRLCIGQAPSCRTALQECAPAVEEDGGEDGGDETDGEADGGEDQDGDVDGATDGESDAPRDAPADARDAASGG